jgi:hypothetical protein
LEAGRRVALVSTFEPSIPSMVRELEAEAARRKLALTVRTASAADALIALQRGDVDRHDQLIVEAGETLGDCEVLMLAQFSMARAAPRFAQRTGRRVLTSPGSAVARLKRDLAQ